jgi:WhiB family redox-sensing transcriptional regulator
METETTWMARGNCAEKPPSLFFPSDGVGVDVARKICVGCAVQETCLEYALEHRIDHGVWGGTSERERRRILRARRIAAAQRNGQLTPTLLDAEDQLEAGAEMADASRAG